jgi:hypothetical protein
MITLYQIALWTLLVEADQRGRLDPNPRDRLKPWIEAYEEVGQKKPTPILMGRHLIESGMKPGLEMGRLLKLAFEAQMDDAFNDIPGALDWLNNL